MTVAVCVGGPMDGGTLDSPHAAVLIYDMPGALDAGYHNLNPPADTPVVGRYRLAKFKGRELYFWKWEPERKSE